MGVILNTLIKHCSSRYVYNHHILHIFILRMKDYKICTYSIGRYIKSMQMT